MPLYVSTFLGNLLVVDQVYISYVVTIQDSDTQDDLIVLDMVDFDVICAWTGYPPTTWS